MFDVLTGYVSACEVLTGYVNAREVLTGYKLCADDFIFLTQESLEAQLRNPSCVLADLSKLSAPLNVHVGMLALSRFRSEHGRMPGVRSVQPAPSTGVRSVQPAPSTGVSSVQPAPQATLFFTRLLKFCKATSAFCCW